MRQNHNNNINNNHQNPDYPTGYSTTINTCDYFVQKCDDSVCQVHHHHYRNVKDDQVHITFRIVFVWVIAITIILTIFKGTAWLRESAADLPGDELCPDNPGGVEHRPVWNLLHRHPQHGQHRHHHPYHQSDQVASSGDTFGPMCGLETGSQHIYIDIGNDPGDSLTIKYLDDGDKKCQLRVCNDEEVDVSNVCSDSKPGLGSIRPTVWLQGSPQLLTGLGASEWRRWILPTQIQRQRQNSEWHR